MKDINELRIFLGETMRDLKAGKLPVEKARAISQLANVVVETARVEVDFIKAAGLKETTTDFINAGHVKLNGETKKPELENKKDNKIK